MCDRLPSRPLLTVKTHSRPSRPGEQAIPAAESELPWAGRPQTPSQTTTASLRGEALTGPLTCKQSSLGPHGAPSCQPETDSFTSRASSPFLGSTVSCLPWFCLVCNLREARGSAAGLRSLAEATHAHAPRSPSFQTAQRCAQAMPGGPAFPGRMAASRWGGAGRPPSQARAEGRRSRLRGGLNGSKKGSAM